MATPSPTPTDSGPSVSSTPSGGSCCTSSPCQLCKTGYILVLLGGLNWGFIGIGGFLGKNLNVINLLLGGIPLIEQIVYVLIGLAALCALTKCCKCHKKK